MADKLTQGPSDLIPGPAPMIIVLRNQTGSPLLRLSGELRNIIYELALDLGGGRILHDDHNDWSRENLIHTCHQIYSETARTYWKQKLEPLLENGVSFGPSADNNTTVGRLTPPQRSCIYKVFLGLEQIMRLLTDHPNLFLGLRNLRKVIARFDIVDPGDTIRSY